MELKEDYFYEDYRLPEFYDCVYNNVTHDIEFWKDISKKSKNILEIACGTGRVTLELAKNRNLEIDAIDFSSEMLEKLRIKSNNFKNINIFQKDMRNFEMNKKYDCILITSNSLNHIETREDIDKVFKCIKKHLDTEGILVFDILNPKFNFLLRDDKNKYDERVFKYNEDKDFIMWENSNYDYSSQINTVNYYYQFLNNNVLENKIYKQKIKVRLFYPQEMDYIIENNGLMILDKFDWYDKRKFIGKTGEQIYLLKNK